MSLVRDSSGEPKYFVGVLEDMTEDKWTEEVQQQPQRERLVVAMQARICQSLNLDTILSTTVNEVRQFLQADRVVIYRFALNEDGVVVAESVGTGWSSMLGLTISQSWFAERIAFYRQGKTRVVHDRQQATHPPVNIEFANQWQIKANLSVPILHGEELFGTLSTHQCSKTRRWEQSEISLMQQLATQVAIAIHQAQLYEQKQYQAQREQALNRVNQAIRSSLDLETVFATAVDKIGKLLQVDRASIVQYLPERRVWLNVSNYRRDPNSPDALGLEIPDESNEIAARLKQLEIVRLDDASTFEDEVNRSVAQTFPGAWLLVPLHHTCLWGSLSLVLDRHPHHWQDSEVELTCAVADQLAMAIQQSELYQQVQQLNSDLEGQVLERTAQLQQALNFEAMLKRITDKVRDNLDESQILQTAVRELALGLQVNRCDTAMYNADQTTATISYEYATSMPSTFQGCVVQMTDFPDVYHQLLQGECLQFCEIGSNPFLPQGTRLACPIFDDRGILGDLWLFKQEDYVFGELEIRLVQQVANQCAIAIRQARLYQAVQAQVEELAKLHQLKDEFLSTVSHELRTPMSNIKIAIQMLTVTLSRNSALAQQDRIHQYLQILQNECAREISLINDLLDLRQLEAEQPLALEPIHLQTWLPQIVGPFAEQIRNASQTLRLDIPPTLPPLVSDPSSLERILAELLNNACKYTPAGEQIALIAAAGLDTIELKVINAGNPIPSNEIPRIFDKFYRIPSTDPWKRGGTGLGLALVQKLTVHLGGTIQVESTSNHNCFTVELPLLPSTSRRK